MYKIKEAYCETLCITVKSYFSSYKARKKSKGSDIH